MRLTIRHALALARLLTALTFLLTATGDPAAAASAATPLPAASSSPAAPVSPVAGASATADTAHCVDSSSLDLRRLLAPPPRAGSPRNRAELDELLRIQALRTPSEAALARLDAA